MKTKNKIDKREIELITAHVTKKTREFLLTHPEFKIGILKNWKIKILIKKRQKGIPLAYLVGHKEFFNLDFIVNKHTLIPRPETEIMVEETIQEINKSRNQKITLIDIGTGSGCIPVSILKNLQTYKLTNLSTFAIDISKKALRIAKKNAQKHNVNIKFLHGNLLSPILKSPIFQSSNLSLVITANLPYLTKEQFANERSIQHEPKLALIADKNGLSLYKELLKQIVKCQMSDVRCFFEIDPSQSQSITKLIKKYLPQASIEIKQDYNELDRVVIIK